MAPPPRQLPDCRAKCRSAGPSAGLPAQVTDELPECRLPCPSAGHPGQVPDRRDDAPGGVTNFRPEISNLTNRCTLPVSPRSAGGGVRVAGAAHPARPLRGGAGGWVGVWHVVSAAVGGWVCVDTVISAAVAGALGHILSAAAPVGAACARIGGRLAELCRDAAAGRGDCGRMFTIDQAELRLKIFFGWYLLPAHWVDAIPGWLIDAVVRPAAAAGMVPSVEWVNQVVVMAYDRGGSIRSHTDPVQLFHRPVVTTSFGCECSLAFGVRWHGHAPGPAADVHRIPRGGALGLRGYAADAVPHCIRQCDVAQR
eukprot:gene1374-2697_t